MTKPSNTLSIARRHFIASSSLALAALSTSPAEAATKSHYKSEDHWAQKGDVKLYIYRKYRADGVKNKPVLFLVHGSSFSGRGGFDLQVKGHPNYSFMEEFADYGFDVWTMDHENYGRSSRTSSNSNIRSGADDLKVGFRLVEEVTGQKALRVYAQSSGAIRAGVFGMEEPERFDRLVLDAFTWTGEGAPEIMNRRKQVEAYKAKPYREMTRETFRGIFSRDDPSTFEPAMADALADYELALGNRAPSGTYLDMAINMPMVDPTKLPFPVMMTRAATDGNATEAELLEFFSKLPNKDKQFAMMTGVAHVAVLGINRHRIWHVMKEFFTYPPQRKA
jgi:pimeloyl-ACP methyl ester carboxylesterase